MPEIDMEQGDGCGDEFELFSQREALLVMLTVIVVLAVASWGLAP